MQPAIFLDRDGVIIENRADYVTNWSDVSIYSQALVALAKVSDLPYPVVIVTNQSAVGRGLLSLKAAKDINNRIIEEIEAAGGRIDKLYICPHAPWENCECRKPKPGMFLQAADELSLDLAWSIMIGDALTDMLAAKSAGISRMGLVLTGRGAVQAELPEADAFQPLPIYTDLLEAFASLVLTSKSKPQSFT